MRTAEETTVLETGGAMNARRSTIKTSKKTFRMVISGIYSDIIDAIVREVAANAWDSQKRAQQDRPFFVHCPTALKPEFYVRDFGTGMTDQVMEEVYIVVGESDKEMTDEEVGKWGLGSKSPFGYGDQYYISCYDGEEVRHYGYGLAEDGVPTLYLMEQEPCDEPRGVRVGFSVEAKDFAAFQKSIEIAAVAHEGHFETNLPPRKAAEMAFEGEGWSCYVDSPLPLQGSGWFARQGCVLYPISATHVQMPSNYHHSRNHVFIVDCPIGTIQITTSREAIQYDDTVVAYLNQRIEKVCEEVKASVWERVKDIKSVTEFFDTITKIRPSFLKADFEHPITGLTSASLRPTWPNLFFEATLDNHGRWEFKMPSTITLKDFKPQRVIAIDDITDLLDPSRDSSDFTAISGLAKSEQRRVSRFTRAYLEANNLKSAMFFLNINWTEEFWQACFPSLEAEKITFDDLRKAVPRRVVPPKEEAKPPIRGLALAKSAGEQKPVFEVSPAADGQKLAWVTSEQYRRQASALFKLAKRYKIDALYISAPAAQGTVEAVGIRHLLTEIEGAMEAAGSSFADWKFFEEKLTDYQIKAFITYLRILAKIAPAAYTKLARGKGEHAQVAKGLKRLLLAKLPELTDEEKKAVDALLVDGANVKRKDPTPADVQSVLAPLKVLSGNHYYNPTCKFVNELHTLTTKDQLTRATDALIALQAIIPASEKFK